MSHDLEKNKIIAAVLVAGIVAYFGGFLAKHVLIPVHHEDKAYIDIDTSALEAGSGGGEAKPAGPEPILALLATADVKKGEALSKACLACHGFEKGGPNKVGPNLWGIVNNKKAHQGDFAYSDIIKKQAAEGAAWTYQNLNAFLWKPAAYAPGTKMTYPGLKKPEDRAALIAFLRTQADSAAPLPSDADIAAEAPKEEPAADEAKDAKAADGKESKDEKAEPATASSAATSK